ncbi:WD40 repeat-like protein [Wolfiporia cocos MD-104 SS10]|uniref:WD40 repeat-like protein n=1 Tax=Wolfiporia cocos (strain MD-104) TaxID=742152 RepID=A0A2H3JB60_WOLCO|nr:WD40 repeat-like protein [Wolfiporia cocos MD-104 SS10]
MVKHPHKKQKTVKGFGYTSEAVQPLGAIISATDDAAKDDEERRLESSLFGTPYEPSGQLGIELPSVSDEEDEDNAGAKELQNLLDSDLFFIDDGVGQPPQSDQPTSDVDFEEGNFHTARDPEDEEEPDKMDVEETSDGQNKGMSQTPAPFNRSRHRKSAWVDPDDPTLQVSLSTDKRRRKLRDALSEDVVGGREYERRLRRQFEKINPTPSWAVNARTKLQSKQVKRRRPSSLSASESDEDAPVSELLSDTRGILQRSRKTNVLSQGTIAIERLRDANLSAKAEGAVKTIQFHPSPQVPVLLTASADRRLRLFNIDGHTNPHLQTVHIPDLPLTNALFHPSGASVLLTGPRPYYYIQDLQSGATIRSPRGLWGTTFTNANTAAQDGSLEMCAFDPTGSVLAVAGRRGHIHLVDWRGGQGQVVGSVKMNVGVKSLWWAGGGRSELMTLGEDAEVYMWDVGGRKCVRRWNDDGGYGSRILGGDRAGQYLAIGCAFI